MINEKVSPLNATILANLHCFACTAKHMSFTLAAKELHLTQSAVSHRIKNLEQQLGFNLFLRFNRNIELTAEGKQLLSVIGHFLHTINTTIQDIRHQDISGHLTLSAPASFSINWLASRLGQLQASYPQLSIAIETPNNLRNFLTENVDAAIYYGTGNYPGLYAKQLMTEVLQPVCSPEYAAEHDLYGHPDNIKNCLIFHDSQACPETEHYDEWEYWQQQSGNTSITACCQYSFDMSEAAIQAAVNGQGIALGRLNLINSTLQAGHLVTPFGQSVTAKHSYYFVCHPDRVNQPTISALINWLLQEVEKNQTILIQQ
ncbi:DNA-binding transcriptional regulator DsdC [Spartinivicinus poritis]|uniref:DNA-binding transcriptional regulator DsdC n=1 Tax=Spartinivicinus poritis TaxID=2994640 RepID=A0ABT5U8F4_9GAMM|nr:DNA-binding transcriptional regulator DsdC [Spartinivicinus sp. A2-2]MDE1462653.1 DNA-binding transcriptional regulator DsdC [Spartinivicinus sp. A2-2]